jgi:hypothetical protein
LLDKKEVEGTEFEPLTFCLASNDANHYTRDNFEQKSWSEFVIASLCADHVRQE